MRPTGLELLHGVRTLLLTEVLPEVTAPHLRSQVMMAVGMLDSAARELDDAPAAFREERARLIALAATVLPVIRRASPDSPLVGELERVASAPDAPPDLRLTALEAESDEFLDVLDRLAAFADEHADGGGADVAALGRRVADELRLLIGRRAAWIGGSA